MANSSSLALAIALAPRSIVELVDPNVASRIVKEIFIAQYFQVAILTVLVFDASRYSFCNHADCHIPSI